MTSTVKFNTHKDIIRFSELASQEDFNILISTAFGQLDAKSLLALFTLLGKDVTVVAPDSADVDKFNEFLSKYQKD